MIAKGNDEEKKDNIVSSSVKTIKNIIDTGKNYKWFVALFAIGCIFIFLSLCFLPFFVLAPARTANMFNIGIICILIAFSVNKGCKTFFKDEFFCGPRPRNFFAWALTLAFILCTYFSIFKESYVASMIFLILEVVLMVYFVACYFPGGIAGVTIFFKALCLGLKNVLCCCCKKGAEKVTKAVAPSKTSAPANSMF